MAKDFLIGCHRLTFHPRENISIEREFELVKEAGVFDYIDWLPRPEIVDECIRCSEKFEMPIYTGTFQYMLGRDDALLELDMRNAVRCGVKVHNVMLFTHHADGHELSNTEVVDCYLRTYDFAQRIGLTTSFEVHVLCWSEQVKRVIPVAHAVRRVGVPFNFTLDYSHCIFKIGNAAEQDISRIREDVDAGRVILDPFEAGNLCDEWLNQNMVLFAQLRPVSPNGPPNIWAKDQSGNFGRGIQYPFFRPKPGEFHSPWYAYRLEASKEAIRKVMRYHLTHPESPLQYMNTEMISILDYGENAGYSIFEHNIAVAKWIRATWAHFKAMQAAGVPLQPDYSA